MPQVPRDGRSPKRGVDRTLAIIVGAAAAIVAALVVGSIVLRDGDDSSGPPVVGDTAVVDGLEQTGTVLGDPAATVTLLQYEDLQCPNCLQYTASAFPAIVDEYVRDGRVKIDFRGVAFIGDDSTRALRAVLAAAKQNKAWQLIELLYQNQGEENSGWVTDVLIEQLAASIDGLDVEQMLIDAQSDAVGEEIDAVRAEAEDREVQGTPWFFVQKAGGKPQAVLPRPYDPALLSPALDAALQG